MKKPTLKRGRLLSGNDPYCRGPFPTKAYFLLALLVFFGFVGAPASFCAEDTPSQTDVVDTAAGEPYETELAHLREEIAAIQKELAKKQDSPKPSSKFTVKPGGIVIMDSLAISQGASDRAFFGDVENNTFFRDLRLIVKGEGYDRLKYDVGLTFQNGISYKNIALDIGEVPVVQNVRVGHFKVETCMTELEAVFDVASPAYNSNSVAFGPHRRIGIASMMFSDDSRWRWFNGVFTGRNLNNGASVDTDSTGIILNTRVTGTPLYLEDGQGRLDEMIHLGGSFVWNNPGGEQGSANRLRIHPTGWSGEMPYLLCGNIPLDQGTYRLTGIEAAWQKGRFGVQSETFVSSYDGFGTAWGTTLLTRFLLEKGSYRTYSKEKGCFATPFLPHGVERSEDRVFPEYWGSLELVGMFSWTDLQNLKYVPGSVYGNYDELQFGLNWWWNSQLRWTFTWTRGHTNATRYNTSDTVSSSNNTIGLQMNTRF